MIREREIAAYLCGQWRHQLTEMIDAIGRLQVVLLDSPGDDGGHEIAQISEAQGVASAIQEACNQMRTGIGRAFPTEQEKGLLSRRAAAPSSTEPRT